MVGPQSRCLPTGTDVVGIKNHIARQLPLDTEVPLVHIRSPEFRIHHPLADLAEVIDGINRLLRRCRIASGSLDGRSWNIEVQTVVLDGIDRRPVPAEILRELDDGRPTRRRTAL